VKPSEIKVDVFRMMLDKSGRDVNDAGDAMLATLEQAFEGISAAWERQGDALERYLKVAAACIPHADRRPDLEAAYHLGYADGKRDVLKAAPLTQINSILADHKRLKEKADEIDYLLGVFVDIMQVSAWLESTRPQEAQP
jgi:hypothetical protein